MINVLLFSLYPPILTVIPLAGVPRLNTPPLLSSTSLASNQERVIAAPKPLRITPNLVNRLDDLSQPWTRSPTKSKMEPVLATWHFVSPDRSPADGSAVGTIFHLLKLRTYSL